MQKGPKCSLMDYIRVHIRAIIRNVWAIIRNVNVMFNVCTLYLLYVRSVYLCPFQCYILKYVHHFLGTHQYQAQVL